MAKPQTCPQCGNRLFLYDDEGKKCSKCGCLVEANNAPTIDDIAPTPAASTFPCPTCGDLGVFAFKDNAGKDWYDCRTCGNRYAGQPATIRRTCPAPSQRPSTPNSNEPKVMDGREIFAMAKKCTIETRKWLKKQKGFISGASGFYITSDLVLTCSHCVLEGEIDSGTATDGCKLESRFKEGQYAPCTLLYYDIQHDLALLKASAHCARPAIIAKENAQTGETIYSVGNSSNKGTCILQGIVADELREVGSKKRPMMMISANTIPGNSGCPTFNERGEVVGVHTSGEVNMAAMKYDAPVTRIRSFLKDAEAKLGITIKLK